MTLLWTGELQNDSWVFALRATGTVRVGQGQLELGNIPQELEKRPRNVAGVSYRLQLSY